jgi:hypothetical protein
MEIILGLVDVTADAADKRSCRIRLTTAELAAGYQPVTPLSCRDWPNGDGGVRDTMTRSAGIRLGTR